MKRNVLFISSTGGHLDELMQLSPMFENMIIILLQKNKIKFKIKRKISRKNRLFSIWNETTSIYLYI